MEETKKCPFCAEEIKIEAKKCKHCGSMLEEEDVKNKAINKKTFIEIMKEQNKVNKSKYLTGKQTLIVFGIGILVILFACINSYYNPNLLGNNTTSNNSNTQITSGRCNYEMKEEIKKNYKSPSTVEFVECNWDRSRGTYGEIWGEIDSQNGFGAIVRSSFTCSDEVGCIITQR